MLVCSYLLTYCCCFSITPFRIIETVMSISKKFWKVCKQGSHALHLCCCFCIYTHTHTHLENADKWCWNTLYITSLWLHVRCPPVGSFVEFSHISSIWGVLHAILLATKWHMSNDTQQFRVCVYVCVQWDCFCVLYSVNGIVWSVEVRRKLIEMISFSFFFCRGKTAPPFCAYEMLVIFHINWNYNMMRWFYY